MNWLVNLPSTFCDTVSEMNLLPSCGNLHYRACFSMILIPITCQTAYVVMHVTLEIFNHTAALDIIFALFFQTWKTRWFVLDNEELRYYAKERVSQQYA